MLIEEYFPALFSPQQLEQNQRFIQDMREMGTYFIATQSAEDRREHEEIGSIWMQAIRDENMELISQLLKSGVELNRLLTCGSLDGFFFEKATPLHMACLFKKKGHLDLMFFDCYRSSKISGEKRSKCRRAMQRRCCIQER